jgi:voltage-gated potassium channel Kch
MNKIVFRILAPIIVVAVAIIALKNGVKVESQPELGKLPTSILIFHCVDLFAFGAKDFGMPYEGNPLLRELLYLTYFIAPIISLSALAECMYFFSKPILPLLLFRGNHFIIIGNGRVGKAAILQIQERFKSKPRIVIIDKNIEKESRGLQVFRNNKILINADLTNSDVLDKINIKKAKGIFILTDNEWVNLKTYYQICEKNSLRTNHRIYVRLSSIDLIHFLQNKELNCDWNVHHYFINTHTAATHQLFSTFKGSQKMVVEKLKFSEWTKKPLKQIILIGFGRFAQALLAELYSKSYLDAATLIIVDIEADAAWKNYIANNKKANSLQPVLVNSKIESPVSYTHLTVPTN